MSVGEISVRLASALALVVLNGFFVAVEFAALSILSFAVTLAAYELLVRQTKLTRLLFGMKS